MTYGEGEETWNGTNDDWNNNDAGDASASFGASSHGNKDGCRNCGESGHFVRDCPTKRSSACFKCNEEGHISRECPNAQPRTCRKCNEEGHMARDCPNEPARTCRVCNETGHMARECPQAPPMVCRRCNEEGHTGRDCPNSPPDERGCFNCGQQGHMKQDCPEPQRVQKCRNCDQEGHKAADCTNEKVIRLGEDGQPLPEPVTYIPQADDVTDAAFEQLHYGEGNVDRFEGVQVTVSDADFEIPLQTFSEANLCQSLMEKLTLKAKYSTPTPIQKYTIPIILAGKDIIACSQTGSGKSAAFVLPILQNLLNDPELPNRESLRGQKTQHPLVLVLSPTRELCKQLYDHFRLFSEEVPRRIGVSHAYGGTQVRNNCEQIWSGTHVLCAVPGRLRQFVTEGKVSFSKVRYLVLDEADRMLDQGFSGAIQEFNDHPTMTPKENRQTLMFSATFASDVEQLARKMMRINETVKIVVGILGSVNSDVSQQFIETEDYKAKREALKRILDGIPNIKDTEEPIDNAKRERVIVFVEQKKNADVLAIFLNQVGYSTTTMHGDRAQEQREEALATFRTGRHAVLVATEVAARGLDIKGVGLVINYDLPKDIDKFVHRVGRTGRVGVKGKAISFFDSKRDADLAGQLVKVLNECEQPVPDFISNAASGDIGGGGDADQAGEEETWGNDTWG